MPAKHLQLRLNKPQKAIYDAVAPRRRVFGGLGRGIGKTFLQRRLAYTLIAKYGEQVRYHHGERIRGVRIIALMPTLKQWKDVNAADILDELSPGGAWDFLGAKIDRSTWHITFKNGSWIKPFPASNYNSKTSRGMRCDVILPDEIDDIDAEVYDAVAIPWLSAPWSLGIELPFGTPTRGRHGLWYRFLEEGKRAAKIRSGEISEDEALELPEAQATIEVLRSIDDLTDKSDAALRARALEVLRGNYAFHATYRDAPETVSPLAVARARATTPEATFKREWEADPDAGEGLVYPFDENFHVRDPPPLEVFSEFLVGMDHGWVDPCVLLLGGVQGHGNDAVLWLLAESYESECPNHVWNERAKLWEFAKFWPDPSRPDRINDLRSLGLRVGETDNDIDGGIARVADLLFKRTREDGTKYARLYVSPKCINTIREFGLYRRKKLPDGTFDEKPEDKNNHAMDAARYMAVGRFGRGPNYRNTTGGR